MLKDFRNNPQRLLFQEICPIFDAVLYSHNTHLKIATIIMNKNGIKNYIQHLAESNNVTYTSTPVDALADHITALADDVVQNDDTKDLLVALKRAQVISGAQMNTLLVQYLTAA